MAATLILSTAAIREQAIAWIRKAPHNTVFTLKKPGRTPPQNDRMWAMLTDVSVQQMHNGVRKSPEAWKALFMHALGHEVAFEMGLNGEPFPTGFRSSKMSKEQMSDLMEFISAWGAENGVKFKEAA